MPPVLSRRQVLFGAAALVLRPTPLTLTASDGVKVFAWQYPAVGARKPMVLLFHQAGSNHAEYSRISPRLAAKGYPCLAIDQRSGGRMWGTANRTANALGREADYLAALRDLEAALAWAKRPAIVWGSSYSASLVFLLAAKHPQDVAAVLAFSPGEYLGEPHLVESNARQLHMPVFIDSAKDDAEIAVARTLARACQATQFVPGIAGVHGSSTLRADRNPAGAAENWNAVEAFLSKSAP
jgi:pimeloyl-ACP methyl ester carboxylesterase